MGSKATTRQLLLEAGRRLLTERGLPEEVSLKLTDVLADVQMSTGAAYNIWDNQAAYRADLALHIASEFRWADSTAIVEAIGRLPTDATMYDWIRTACDTYFPFFVANLDFFVVLKFWGVEEPSTELVEAIQAGYSTLHDEFKFFYEASLGHFGYRVVSPYTVDDITTMVTAAIEGTALRHRFEPERLESAGGHLYFSIVWAIASTYTEPDSESPRYIEQ